MFLIQTFIHVLFEILKHIYDCYFEVLSSQSFILLFLGNIMMEMLVNGCWLMVNGHVIFVLHDVCGFVMGSRYLELACFWYFCV